MKERSPSVDILIVNDEAQKKIDHTLTIRRRYSRDVSVVTTFCCPSTTVSSRQNSYSTARCRRTSAIAEEGEKKLYVNTPVSSKRYTSFTGIKEDPTAAFGIHLEKLRTFVERTSRAQATKLLVKRRALRLDPNVLCGAVDGQCSQPKKGLQNYMQKKVPEAKEGIRSLKMSKELPQLNDHGSVPDKPFHSSPQCQSQTSQMGIYRPRFFH